MTPQRSRSAAAHPPPQMGVGERSDPLQSRLLSFTLIPLLAGSAVLGLFTTGEFGGRYKVAGVSIAFAALVAAIRSATPAGAICGALICFSLTWWTRDLESPLLHSALLPLAALFLFTFTATAAGRKKKQERGLAERAGGRRASQVLANLATAALVVTPLGAIAGALAGLRLPVSPVVLATAALAALAEATADTVSSETGQAFGRRTYLVTTLRRVHRGTDGGVSLVGSSTGVAAATAIVLVGGWAMRLAPSAQALCLLAALAGFVADSLLGATLERRGWIGNDLVNFTSTAVASSALLLLTRLCSGPR